MSDRPKLLDLNQLEMISDSLVKAGLEEDRDSLLSGIPEDVRVEMPVASNAPEQFTFDLEYLAGRGVRPGEPSPLQVYVDNAAHKLGATPDGGALIEASEEVAARVSAQGGGEQMSGLVEPKARMDPPASMAFLNDLARSASSIVRVEVTGRGLERATYTTGFLISGRHVMTTGHVAVAAGLLEDSPKASATVRLDFDSAEVVGEVLAVERCVAHHEALDVAVLALAEDTWRTPLRLEEHEASDLTSLSLIHHASGPKQALIGTAQVVGRDERDLHYLANTANGSSGAPLLDESLRVVALHQAWLALDAPLTFNGRPHHRVRRGTRASLIVEWLRSSHPDVWAETGASSDTPSRDEEPETLNVTPMLIADLQPPSVGGERAITAGDHVINLAPDGTFRPTGHYSTTPEAVDAMVAAAAAHPSGRLTLHFHGGLVKEAAGIETARRMAQTYDGVSYPVTFVWETGLFEVLRSNLSTIWTTKLFQKLARLLWRRLAPKLFAPSAAFSPSHADASFEALVHGSLTLETSSAFRVQTSLEEQKQELERELTEDFASAGVELRGALDESVASEVEALLRPELKPNANAGGFSTSSIATLLTFAVKIGWAVLRRYREGRDHGAWPTLLEEILRAAYVADFGAWFWSRIKASAEAMWAPPAAEGPHGGWYLLQKLSELETPLTLDVVGHSAGSIAICHLIEHLAATGSTLKIRNVTFLAPACRHDLFARTVMATPDRFERFHMFTMDDAHEAKDALINAAPGVYPRSLLYLVSGAAEDESDAPILGMERYLSGRAPYVGGEFDAVREFIGADGRLRLSPTDEDAPLGERTTALDHGEFDNDPPTLESLRHLASVD